MSTSATTGLSEPTGTDKISLGTLGYIRTRNKQRAYKLVIREFKKSGLRNADLAKRLGKAPEVVHRLLSRPQNWGLDTFSDLLFAISGAVLKVSLDRPLEGAALKSFEIKQPVPNRRYQPLTVVKSNTLEARAAA